MQPAEVILRVIEEVQLFLLANTDEYRALTYPNLISYALIKLKKTGGGVFQRHRELAKEATTGSTKMGRIIGPHGIILQDTANRNGGHHNGTRGVRHSPARRGRPH